MHIMGTNISHEEHEGLEGVQAGMDAGGYVLLVPRTLSSNEQHGKRVQVDPIRHIGYIGHAPQTVCPLSLLWPHSWPNIHIHLLHTLSRLSKQFEVRRWGDL